MLGTDYTLNNGATITVPAIMGSSTKIKELDDGTYAVETTGSLYGAKPETAMCTADELVEKYSVNLERVPSEDAFSKLSDEKAENSYVNITYPLIRPSSISGNFEGVDYNVSEGKRLLSDKVDYSGTINGKEAQYQVSPSNGILTNGSIKGLVGDEEVNLSLKKSLLGKIEITGTYKGEEINLTIQGDLFGNKYITGENTNVKIDNKFLSRNKSIDGEFSQDKELMPIILSYLKVDQDKQNRESAEASMYI